MQKMKKANSDNSLGCGLVVMENVGNFLLHCVLYTNIRDKYIPKFCTINKKISKEIFSWTPYPLSTQKLSVSTANELSRQFRQEMHRKRDTFYKDLEKVK